LYENLFKEADLRKLQKQLLDESPRSMDSVISAYASLTNLLNAGKDSGLSEKLFVTFDGEKIST
jgi:hypothetical protein